MNPLETQVFSIPDLFEEVFKRMEEQTHTILTTPEMYSVKKIYLVGSGDSFDACLTVKETFEKMVQIPVVCVDPFDLVCYEQMKWVGESPLDPLVIAVSNSGMAERTKEAVDWMRAHNALTIGITANPESPFGKSVERVLDISIPKFGHGPGCRSFFMMQLTLYLLALRMGVVRLKFNMENRQKCLDGMKEGFSWLKANLAPIAEQCREYASSFKNAVSAEAIGTGPDEGTARYAKGKWYEACGIPCVVSNSENWFHENYFLRNQNTPILVFSSCGNIAQSRTEELVIRMNEMGRKFLLVTDSPAQNAERSGSVVVMHRLPYSWLQPILNWVVPALVTSYWSEQNGEEYMRGFKSVWKETEASYNTMNTKAVR